MDGHKDGRMDRHGQNYIPPPSVGNNKISFKDGLDHVIILITSPLLAYAADKGYYCFQTITFLMTRSSESLSVLHQYPFKQG